MNKVAVDKRRQVWEQVFEKERSLLTKAFGKMKPGMVLAVDIVDNIYSNHSDDYDKTYTCCDIYVNCHPDSSWEHLTSLLYRADQMAALDQARPFLTPRGNLNSTNKTT